MTSAPPTRFSAANPCPVCNSGTKGCSVTKDGLHWCRGEPADAPAWKCVKRGDTFNSYRRASDNRHQRNGTSPKRTTLQTPARDWQVEANRLAAAMTSDLRAELSGQLGLPVAALAALPLIGWTGSAWTFPECDGIGRIIGISTRDRKGRKRMIPGGHRGLTIPANWRERTWPVFTPEGPSDVLGLTHAGLNAIGRPSNTSGAEMLAVLMKDLPPDCPLIVLGEHDRKDDGSWPGRAGAERIAGVLRSNLRSHVSIAYPPHGLKDARAWVLDLASGQGEGEDWPAIGEAIRTHCVTSGKAPPQPAVQDREPHTVTLSSVEAVNVSWLWPDRIPLGRITVVAGRPGCGKSILTLDMVAHVTRGANWPDGTPCPQGSVLLLAAEDDLADTVRPRLNAANADANRVVALQGVRTRERDGRTTTSCITLADLDAIDAALTQMPDCKLLIVDPIGSYLGGRTDSHRDNEVRAVLAPLAELAARRSVAVVVVCHTRKGGANTHADDAVMGSVGFVGLARAVHHIVADPEDGPKQRKLLLPGKCNLAPPQTGFAFRVEGRPPHVLWEGPVGQTADEVLSAVSRPGPEPACLRDAGEWLQSVLAHGARLAKEIQDEAVNGEGLSVATLRRAQKATRVVAYRPENPGPWWWKLPDEQMRREPLT